MVGVAHVCISLDWNILIAWLSASATTLVLVSAFFEVRPLRSKPPNAELVYVRDDREEGFSGLIKWVVEYLLLCRFDQLGYKNGLSGSLRVFSSAIISFYAFSLFYLLQLFIGKATDGYDAIVFSVGVFGVVFWRERTSLYSKWRYLAHLYNESLKADCELSSDILTTALAIDILDIDMWAHRSFRRVFYQTVKASFNDSGIQRDVDEFLRTGVKRQEVRDVLSSALSNKIRQRERQRSSVSN